MGLGLSRVDLNAGPTKSFKRQFDIHLNELIESNSDFKVYPAMRYDVGNHPRSNQDFECEFASRNLAKTNPDKVLDVGSYRRFIIGLLAGYNVTTLDVRSRETTLSNETVLTSDAKQLDIPSDSFDSIVSLCAIEHFGLGRYGDEFDITADKKGFSEMVRVLRPGGSLIFTTTITMGEPHLGFNAHRIYNHEMIEDFCQGLTKQEETYFSYKMNRSCTKEEVTNLPKEMDIYCGCWTKN